MTVDCRGLIEFCRSFEQHKNMFNTSDSSQKHGGRSKKASPAQLSGSPPLCEQSPAAAVDLLIFLFVLIACGFLFTSYFKYMYICAEVAKFLPIAMLFMAEVVRQAPVAYIAGLLVMFGASLAGWEAYQHQMRRCGDPRCKGLKKAMEFNIQLETEQCVKSCAYVQDVQWKGKLELGDDNKELEAELRRMAPVNGRAVLICRAPCGCPAARMEVWGYKKGRRLKKLT